MRANEFLAEYAPPALINKTVDVDGIQLSINADGANVTVYALSDGRQLGYVVFDRDGKNLVADDLAIEERYQGQGIAKIMYDYVKHELGFNIERSWNQTDAGKGFWKKHRGRKRVWEDKTLDPEIYGEFLPFPTMRKIVQSVVHSVDPDAKLKIKDDWGTCMVEGEKIRLDFSITADAGEITAYIVNAYSSYKGAGVIQEILRQCFAAMVQLYGQPQKFNIATQEDRGHGVWQHMAQKLGAEWGGSNR